MKIPKIDELFDLSHTLARPLLEECTFPEMALDKLKAFIELISPSLGEDYYERAPGVFVAKTAKIADSAEILPPAIIGNGAQIRHGAYLRGTVIIGDGAVIGNSSEVKCSVIFDEAKLPHYSYVGDSIIGYSAHMGAGAIVSNLRLDKKEITIKADGEARATGRRKLGALIGDRAEIGCGAVLCPGSVIGKESFVYPLALVRGVIGSRCIFDGKEAREIGL